MSRVRLKKPDFVKLNEGKQLANAVFFVFYKFAKLVVVLFGRHLELELIGREVLVETPREEYLHHLSVDVQRCRRH